MREFEKSSNVIGWKGTWAYTIQRKPYHPCMAAYKQREKWMLRSRRSFLRLSHPINFLKMTCMVKGC